MKHIFSDSNGFIDVANRYIGRWVWADKRPHPEWREKPIYQWTATELFGISKDDWGLVIDNVRPFPNDRSLEQKIADDLYWGKPDRANYTAQQLTKELPRIVKK